MAMINRLARLFKADLHAVLDHIEEPELQLNQSIREMQDELEKTESEIAHAGQELDYLHERKKSAEKLIKQTNGEIDICLSNDNDDLARGLIRRRLEANEIVRTVDQHLSKVNQTLKSLAQQQQEHRAVLQSMQQKSELLSTQRPVKNRSFTVPNAETFQIQDSDIEVALLQEKDRFAAQGEKQ